MVPSGARSTAHRYLEQFERLKEELRSPTRIGGFCHGPPLPSAATREPRSSTSTTFRYPISCRRVEMAVSLFPQGAWLDSGGLDQVRLTCMARVFCIIKLTINPRLCSVPSEESEVR
jgi:hypothetical protein